MIHNLSKDGKTYKTGLVIIKTSTTKLYYVYGTLYKLNGSAPQPITTEQAKQLLN